jgi:hypothetical protein
VPPAKISKAKESPKFEATKLEGLYPVLDDVAWLDSPSASELAQFAGLDARTVGKILKNAQNLKIIDKIGSGHILLTSYPYKGTAEQKELVVKEALLKFPLLVNMRQFLSLGESQESALRKAATLCKYVPFDEKDFTPLLTWARSFDTLKSDQISEDLVEEAEAHKEARHKDAKSRPVIFLSHSSHDKPFVRQLAADLTSAGIDVWLDEQRIKLGDSIPEKISQGLASSDFFALVVSKNSAKSEWVSKELNNALVNEVQRRKVYILPLKIDDSEIPSAIRDKKYADFSQSYRAGLSEIIRTVMEGI